MTQALVRKKRGVEEPQPQRSAKKIKTGADHTCADDTSTPDGMVQAVDQFVSSDDSDCGYPLSEDHTSISQGEVKQPHSLRSLTDTDLCIYF